MKYLYNPPLPVKLLFRDSRWTSAVNKILFTFDDGPVQNNTDLILKKLEQYNIKALFFCVGNNIKKNPGLIIEMLREGHHIGNHTMNHKILSRAGINDITEEVIPFNKMMSDQFGYKVKYFRPPHGRLSLRLNSFLKKNELTNIMWSLLTYDYKKDINEVKRSLSHLRGNSIVVFHDSIKSRDIISESIEFAAEKILTANYITGLPEECLK